MDKRLPLKEIYFGKVDAKNELLENTNQQRLSFKRSFILPAHFNTEDFRSGSRQYIYGMKGTGKTSFLRYLSIVFEDERQYDTSFILFKSDFGEGDRQSFSSAANKCLNQSQFDDYDNNQDFEPIWKWFLFRHIVEYMTENKLSLFEKDDVWDKFSKHVQSIKLDDEKTGLSRLIPKIKRGEAELNTGAAKLGLDFEFDNSKVKFNHLVKIVEKYFDNLTPIVNKDARLYIFIDELELSYQSSKIYKRDSGLIRDLVIVTNKINSLCRAKKLPIYCITSVRSEVLSSINAIGKEINKVMEDFGLLIAWHQSGGDLKSHPLLTLILKRMAIANKQKEDNYIKLWDEYMPETIQGQPTENYIMYNTWYRPRDIVRLLTLAQTAFPDETTLEHKIFDAIRKNYSMLSWSEALEELTASYSSSELDVLKNILTGWEKSFAFNGFCERVREMNVYYPETESLQKRGLGKVLNDLYRVGVIGNQYKEGTKFITRFIFRGDETLLITKEMMIHHALRQHLSLF